MTTVTAGYPPLEREWQIVLLIDSERNETLLAEWLSDTATVVRGDDSSLDGPFDLCIADPVSLSRHGSKLATRRESEGPQFLPCLAVVPSDRDGQWVEQLGESVVDDVVELPAKKWELQQRIEILLRTRRLSLSLDQRKEQYRRLVESLPEAVFLVQDGEIVFTNAEVSRVFGQDRAATDAWLLGRAFTELVEDADRDTVTALLETVRETGSADEFVELTLVDKQGQSHDCSVGCVRVTYDEAPAVQIVVRDLTERNQREEQLRLFNRALDDAEQGVTIADARQDDLPLIYTNAAFEDITGYSSVESLGRNCRFLQGPETDPEQVATIRRALAAERPVSLELRNYRADGRLFWNQLDITPVRDTDGDVTHFIGFQRDVTERKRMELTLRERTETLRALTQTLPVIQFALAPEGVFTHSEGSALSSLGLKQNEVVGESLFDVYAEAPDICADARRALDGEQVHVKRHYDGHVFDIWYQPLLDEDGAVTRVVGLAIDITEDRRREQRLSVLHRILRHNLRNRMTVIRGRAEQARGLDADAADPHLDEIIHAADDLVRLADKARDVQQLFEDDTAPEQRDVVSTIERTVAGLRGRYPEATIDLSLPDSAPVVTHHSIELAIEQLVENGIVHDPGTAVVTVSVDDSDETVTIAISDTGPGLPATERAVLTSDAESQLAHSQGLGLWLVRWVVEMAGGSVAFTVDDGTTVSLELPAA